MKGIFKLFPVALALVALASCSSDDLTGDNVAQVEFDPSKLYVTVENYGEDITRAGWEAHPNAARTTLTKALFFQKNDQLKVYDEKTNWRPQLWEYEGTANVTYTGSAGVAGGESSIFTLKSTNAKTQYVNGYGVFPAALGEFKNENRSRMEFDLRPLKKMDYKTGASTKWAEDGKAYYVAYLPMWGVAKESAMTMKYLTGILRIDMNLFPAINGANAANETRYLVVVGDKQLWSATKASVGNDDPSATDAIDPEKLNEEAPQIDAATVTTPWTAGTAITIATPAENVMLIDLKNLAATGATAADLVAYIPVLCGNTNVKVYYSNQILRTKTTIDDTDLKTGGNYNLIGELDAAKIKAYNEAYSSDDTGISRGITYVMVNDDNNTNAVATTPWSLAQELIKADKAASRDFTLTFTKDILVQNEDATPQDEYFDLSNGVTGYGGEDYTLKHNVTIKIKAARRVSGLAATLKIKNLKVMDGKKLTLDFDENPSGTPVDVLDIPADQASKIVLKGNAIPTTVNVATENVTISGNIATVNAKSTINIDGVGKNIAKLNLYAGANQINVLNGTIGTIEYTPSATKAENVAGTVNFYSEGISGFGAPVKAANAAKSNDPAFEYTSKLTETPATIKSTFSSEAAAKIAGGEIYTVAQFVAIDNSASGYRIMAKEFDLNGSKFGWTPIALTKNINGDYTKATATTNAKKVCIKNMNINIAATVDTGTGLFATTTGNIRNIELKDITIHTASAATACKNIGALVGIINGTSPRVWNVTLTGTNTITTVGLSENIGALIGKAASTDLKLMNVKVEGNTKITGYTSMGGLIGLIQNGTNVDIAATSVISGGSYAVATSYASGNNYCSVENVEFVQNTKPGQEYAPAYGRIGDFIGSVETTSGTTFSVVKIYTSSIPVALERPETFKQKAKFTYLDAEGAAYYKGFKADQQLVGLSGINYATTPASEITDGTSNPLSVNILTAPATGTTYVTTPYIVSEDKPTAAEITAGTKFLNYIDK